jgi:hypothetical protein
MDAGFQSLEELVVQRLSASGGLMKQAFGEAGGLH